jgi:dTDP-4-dehydrorhamnose reductase
VRILVTGTQGQIARSLAEKVSLGATDHDLIFAGRPQLDLAAPDSIASVIRDCRPNLILSVAAYTKVDQAEAEPALAMAVNGLAPGVIGRTAKSIDAAVIHVSTDYVFDGSGVDAWHESDPANPQSEYGRSKLAGEVELAASGARHTIVRTAWVYSPFGQNFVKTMLRLADAHDTIRVVDDQFGNPTSALDIADALLKMADRGKEGPAFEGEIYHLAGSGAVSWAQFAEEIFKGSVARGGPHAMVEGIPTSQYPTLATRPANSRLDCSRFAQTFGVALREWRESLSETLDRLIL